MQPVADPQATQPMRRVRHRAPRLSNIRFLVLMFTGVDIALAGLAAVLFLTPLHPNYPVDTAPVLTPHAPVSAPAVVLPVGHTTPYKPPTSPRSTAPAYRPVVPRPRPSATLTTAPMATASPKPRPSDTTATATPTNTATDIGTPTPTPTGSGN